MHIDQSVLVHLPDKPTSVGVLPFAKNITEYIGWHWDTECYSGIAIQFIVHVILGYADDAFQTSIANPVDVLLYTISVTEGQPHVASFGNWIDVTTT